MQVCKTVDLHKFGWLVTSLSFVGFLIRSNSVKREDMDCRMMEQLYPCVCSQRRNWAWLNVRCFLINIIAITTLKTLVHGFHGKVIGIPESRSTSANRFFFLKLMEECRVSVIWLQLKQWNNQITIKVTQRRCWSSSTGTYQYHLRGKCDWLCVPETNFQLMLTSTMYMCSVHDVKLLFLGNFLFNRLTESKTKVKSNPRW